MVWTLFKWMFGRVVRQGDSQNLDFHELFIDVNSIGSMGMVYLATFTIKINHSCKQI